VALLAEARAIALRQRAQHPLDALARAAALRAQRLAAEDAHAVLVEQAIEQAVGIERGVGELGRSARPHQHQRAAPAVLDRLRIGGEELALLAREALHHQRAAAPAAIGALLD